MPDTELVPIDQKLTLDYVVPAQEMLTAMAQGKLDTANSIEIVDDEMFEIATNELRVVKAITKTIDGLRTASKKPVLEAAKKIDAIYADALCLLSDTQGVYNKNILAYKNEADRKAAQARINAEAAVEAERKRILAEAEKLEQAGKAGEAQATREVAAMVHVPAATQGAPKVAGTAFAKNWKARIKDRRALIVHIAAHPELDGWVDFNMTPINQQAKSMEAALSIPGVEAYNDETIRSRGTENF